MTFLTRPFSRRALMVASGSAFLACGVAVATLGGEQPPASADAVRSEAPPSPPLFAAVVAPVHPAVPEREAPPVLPQTAPAATVGNGVIVEPPAARTWRPTGPADVRVWSNGDSTSYYMSYWTLQMLASLGATPVQREAEYKISSGLVRRDFFDWYSYADRQLSASRPTVVVFMVGANDALQGGSLERYRELVAEMMDRMNAPARRVVWVGQPNVGRADLRAAIPNLNAIFKEEAEKRPWVIFVDAWSLTSDSDGNYAAALPDEDGVTQILRVEDGVHFTSAGGKRLAHAVVEAIFAPTREELAEQEATRREVERTAP